jgi:uncharacterized protein
MPSRRAASTPHPGGQRHEVPLPGGKATTATRYPAVTTAAPPGGRTTLLVLAHGAGAGQHHPFMTSMADRLSARGLTVVTFDFLYVHERRSMPDRAPVLEACFAAVTDWATGHESAPVERLLLGGKSMGGRMATHLASAGFVPRDGAGPPLGGIVALGYPLHPPGRPQQLRDAHLPAIAVPVLIVQGSRDTFGTPSELSPVVARMPADVTLHVVDGGDHSFAVSRTPAQAVLDGVADAIAVWTAALA